ncbi:hypothetical protein HRTV-10_gp35 [Halorubrum tailed virus 10]|uniref:Uncharacterized protein n=1 Tax=Halorubrum tailed virus 10 TaxID=2877991 RepID=A0AAE8XTF7_9CAUD|nr:hypothetical protein M1M36_gp097 [Halorubrum tailed virus 10]UBF19619.1 hypothetical protein HRTV-10_gp35 [Halorubrum tailed virus 10]
MDFSSVTDAVSDLSNKVRLDGSPAEEEPEEDQLIEFVTDEELYGAIPEPIPANKVLPDWYKKLGQYTANDGEFGSTNTREGISRSTVKRCAPFMEAMTMGFIIPLSGEIYFEAKDGYVNYEWEFQEPLISNHNLSQVGGEMFPNHEWPIMKFNNQWCMKVPDGYSVLVTNPLNRPGQPFTPFSGVVDIDNYFNNVNAPFMWTGGDFEGVVPKGTPIIQVIPFKRDAMLPDATTRPMTEDEQLERTRTKNELSSEISMYRNDRWQHKPGSRMLPNGGDE